MSLMEILHNFYDVVDHGILPTIVEYSQNIMDADLALWLSHIEGLYQACAQLHWNSLYVENDDERDCLRTTLENMCRDLLAEQYLVKNYGHRFLSHAFKVSFTMKLRLKETLYEYMKVLGLMR